MRRLPPPATCCRKYRRAPMSPASGTAVGAPARPKRSRAHARRAASDARVRPRHDFGGAAGNRRRLRARLVHEIDREDFLRVARLSERRVRRIGIGDGRDAVHDVHPLHDFSECRVLVVQGRVVLEDHEELGRGRVRGRGTRHRDDSTPVARVAELGLEGDRIALGVRPARVAPDERVLRVLRERIPALDDEVADHAVEQGAVVEAGRGEVEEVLHVVRRAVVEEPYGEVALRRVHDGERVRVVAHLRAPAGRLLLRLRRRGRGRRRGQETQREGRHEGPGDPRSARHRAASSCRCPRQPCGGGRETR